MSANSVGTYSQPSAATAAIRAAMELVVSSGVGVASIQSGILSTSSLKALSQTTFSILLPLFLGTSIIKTITKYGLETSSLVVPALAALQSFLLYVVTTQIFFPLFLERDQIDSDEARGAAICSSFGNSGVLPLIFCDSLFRNTHNNIGSDDRLDLGTGYVSLFLIGWSPFFWSFGRSILLGQEGDDVSNNTTAKIPPAVTEMPTSILSKDNLVRIRSKIMKLIPPPVMGVAVGMGVGTIPFLRNSLVGSSSNGQPPLRVIYDTAQNFGKAASPLSLLILVSSLALGAGLGNANKPPMGVSTGQGNATQTLPTPTTSMIPFWKRWAIVSISRFLVSPALMLALLKLTSSNMPLVGNKIGSALEQPMLWFVCLLESCMPPAQNQVTMLHVANKMQQGNEMATFLFVVYATSMLPLTMIVSLTLDKLGLM